MCESAHLVRSLPFRASRAAQGEMSTNPGESASGVPDTDHPLGGRNSG